ncbi:unnamed protein product [Triticum turgidum subsp. durum]|uniref:Rhodanese domain-containing protein n=1 Tax=Triticum turgidum subsp. durum TaxID=4567 RepID=A0A9R0YSV1_TRITD|nr:unnamed protein product [Triticum turgidum subsp. durum]
MAFTPTSVSATLAPSAPPPPAATKGTPRRAPWNAAPLAAAAASSTAALMAATPAARAAALSKEDVAGSFTKVVDTVDVVIGVGGKVAEQSFVVLRALGEAAKPALPVLQNAGEQALKLASPVVSDASRQATEALQGAGVDLAPFQSAFKTVADAAQPAIGAAKPIASETVQTIGSLEGTDYVVAAGAAFLAYLLLPPAWSLLSYGLRGYKGDLSPAQALDMVTSQGYLIIDVRSENDKAKAGVPQLPSNAKNKIIALPLEELPNKIKGMVRNAKRAEAEIAALKISYLKRIGKGSNIVVMDSYNLSVVEVVKPSRVIPAAAERFVTVSSTSTPSRTTRKLLPGNVDS